MQLKHQIYHEALINGILFKTLQLQDFDKAIEFYFDVYLQGNWESMMSHLDEISMFWVCRIWIDVDKVLYYLVQINFFWQWYCI